MLEYIKEHMNIIFADLDELQREFVDKISRLHEEDANMKYPLSIYKIKETSSYINVKCDVHPKCRFSLWFKFEQYSDKIVNISYFRTITHNHYIRLHTEM